MKVTNVVTNDVQKGLTAEEILNLDLPAGEYEVDLEDEDRDAEAFTTMIYPYRFSVE